MSTNYINKHDKQKIFLKKGLFDIKERLRLLKLLRDEINNSIDLVYDSLNNDYNKPKNEIYITEILPVIHEIKYFIKNIKKLGKDKKIHISPFKEKFFSKIYKTSKSYGSILLIISSDLPFRLAMISIIGAIAAGNTIFLKLAPECPNTNNLIRKMLSNVFDDNHIIFLEDNMNDDDYKEIYKLNFNLVMFFGKTKTSKPVIANFSSKYIDVLFQISSKCCVVVDETANLNLAADRLVWSKLINSGQMSISPDHVLVHETAYTQFIQNIIKKYNEMFPEVKFENKFTKIISKENYKRLTNLIDKNRNRIVFGGKYNDETQSIEFTLINIDDLKSEFMTNEVFGPIVPIIKYNNVSDIFGIMNHNPSPLAISIFTKNKDISFEIEQNVEAKSIILNDIMTQFFYDVPLGGVNNSGNCSFGKKYSWDLFTFDKVVIKSSPKAWQKRKDIHSQFSIENKYK